MATTKKFPEREEKDYQQILTDSVIARMEESKALNWSKPWISCSEAPFNPVTGTRYRGANFVSCLTAGFADPRFFTFNNVRELAVKTGQDIHVKKGAKGIPIFKALQVSYLDKKEGEPDEEGKLRSFVKMKYAGTVFNGAQIEGLEPWIQKVNKVQDFQEAELLSLALQERTNLIVEHSEMGRAYYTQLGHKVHMPNKDLFKSSAAYYDTLAHEFGHSTGPALGRDMTGTKGSAAYAKEELVAELTSMFVCAELGIPHDPAAHENHAAYLESWLQCLKGDKNLIFKAAGQASKSTEFQMKHLQGYKLSHGLVDQVEGQSNKLESKIILPPAKQIARPALVAV
ncbi:ArdC family protein [Roseateles sp. PN1]|uniref:ArdC family protein n=1 Tax=Roseateles sp. PN1 TaxID=3137372 RepID=UPI003139A092